MSDSATPWTIPRLLSSAIKPSLLNEWVITHKILLTYHRYDDFWVFRHCDIFSYNFISLFIFGCAGFLLLHVSFSLVAMSRGYSAAMVHGLLSAADRLWWMDFSLRWTDFSLWWTDFAVDGLLIAVDRLLFVWTDFSLRWTDFSLRWTDFSLRWTDFIAVASLAVEHWP